MSLRNLLSVSSVLNLSAFLLTTWKAKMSVLLMSVVSSFFRLVTLELNALFALELVFCWVSTHRLKLSLNLRIS